MLLMLLFSALRRDGVCRSGGGGNGARSGGVDADRLDFDCSPVALGRGRPAVGWWRVRRDGSSPESSTPAAAAAAEMSWTPAAPAPVS
jgi:hypothetical protein